ncbi:MAG: hypothetical protein HQL11_03190 [Candidatus Omnitrophica bacterium]|nr:hypothetical protein [Candidatus Omnitrophota bacterium]
MSHDAIIDSFKDCWDSFLSQCERLDDERRLGSVEENEFLRTRDAVLERYRKICGTDLGRGLSRAIGGAMEVLGSYVSVTNLSDMQAERLRGAWRKCDSEIGDWLITLRRQNIFVNTRARRERKKRIQWMITVPAGFVLIAAGAIAVGIRFFLNR